MRVLVDTCIWSLALRRQTGDLSPDQRAIRFVLVDLIRDARAILIGPVRQEILSGLSDVGVYERVRLYLREFGDEPILTEDYEDAARCRNRCRTAGVAASPIDMLICSTAIRLGVPIFTTDPDFGRYKAQMPIRVPEIAELQAELRRRRGNG